MSQWMRMDWASLGLGHDTLIDVTLSSNQGRNRPGESILRSFIVARVIALFDKIQPYCQLPASARNSLAQATCGQKPMLKKGPCSHNICFVYLGVCIYIHTYVHACMHAYIHAQIHRYIHRQIDRSIDRQIDRYIMYSHTLLACCECDSNRSVDSANKPGQGTASRFNATKQVAVG